MRGRSTTVRAGARAVRRPAGRRWACTAIAMVLGIVPTRGTAKAQQRARRGRFPPPPAAPTTTTPASSPPLSVGAPEVDAWTREPMAHAPLCARRARTARGGSMKIRHASVLAAGALAALLARSSDAGAQALDTPEAVTAAMRRE